MEVPVHVQMIGLYTVTDMLGDSSVSGLSAISCDGQRKRADLMPLGQLSFNIKYHKAVGLIRIAHEHHSNLVCSKFL